ATHPRRRIHHRPRHPRPPRHPHRMHVTVRQQRRVVDQDAPTGNFPPDGPTGRNQDVDGRLRVASPRESLQTLQFRGREASEDRPFAGPQDSHPELLLVCHGSGVSYDDSVARSLPSFTGDPPAQFFPRHPAEGGRRIDDPVLLLEQVSETTRIAGEWRHLPTVSQLPPDVETAVCAVENLS